MESEPPAEAFTCETYQPFNPLVPLTFTFETGAMVSTEIVTVFDDILPATSRADTVTECTPSLIIADPAAAIPSTDRVALAKPEIESEPLAEAFTCETYQPFDPLVPLTLTFEMGGVGSYHQFVPPEAVNPDEAVTV